MKAKTKYNIFCSVVEGLLFIVATSYMTTEWSYFFGMFVGYVLYSGNYIVEKWEEFKERKRIIGLKTEITNIKEGR